MPKRQISLEYFKSIAGEDRTLLRNLVNVFLQRLPTEMHTAKTLYRQQNWSKLKQLLHKLKPNFGYVGMQYTECLANSLEEKLDENTPDTREITRLFAVLESDAKEITRQLKHEIDQY